MSGFALTNPLEDSKVPGVTWDYPAFSSTLIKQGNLRKLLATAEVEDAVESVILSKQKAFNARTSKDLYQTLLNEEKDMLEKAKEIAIAEAGAVVATAGTAGAARVARQSIINAQSVIDATLRAKYGSSREDMMAAAAPEVALARGVSSAVSRRAAPRRSPVKRRKRRAAK